MLFAQKPKISSYLWRVCCCSVLLATSGLAFGTSKGTALKNTASVAVIANSESSFNLQITLNVQDSFTNWDFGFFMLHVFLRQDQSPLIAQICGLNSCTPLVLDITNPLPAANVADFIKFELSSGHISLFKPTKPFALKGNNTYIINIGGLNALPKNITAMPQSLFLSTSKSKHITPLRVTSYSGYAEVATNLQQRNKANWDYPFKNLNNPSDSIIVPYPVKTVMSKTGYTKSAANLSIHYCQQMEELPCSDIHNQIEGYVLQIDQGKIMIYANTGIGIFYAKQTLMQLASHYNKTIPNQTVIDYPRFKYRGLMLDTVRHFFSVKEIKQLLDVMAAHKLNVLRLHLADDEAWRIQLPEYPALTNIGSARIFLGKIGPSNLVDGMHDISNFSKMVYARADTLYQGYYTTMDIKDMVSYANARQITIIPEIELPGHAKALKKAMPEVFFDKADRSRYLSVQGYTDNVLPICKYGSDVLFTTTLNKLIIAIADLFAEQTTLNYTKNEVSLSGDEVPDTAFTQYAACDTGVFKDVPRKSIAHEFFKQLSANLPKYKLSGYNQLVQSNDGSIDKHAVAPKTIAHIWQWMPSNNKPVSGLTMTSNLSQAGYPTILDFADLSYFDIRYTSQWDEPGVYWAADQTDTFSALSAATSTKHIANTSSIIGMEGALWSELMPSGEHLFYMAIPKMSGLSEAAWTNQQNINWHSLATRLGCGKNGFLAYLNQQFKVRYRGYPNGIKLEVPNEKLCAN